MKASEFARYAAVTAAFLSFLAALVATAIGSPQSSVLWGAVNATTFIAILVFILR